MVEEEDIMKIIRHYLKYGLVFVAVTIVLVVMLLLSAMIPRSEIKEQVRESAEYLCEGELFGTVVEDVNGSKIDRYADSILLAIAYQYDADNPLTSVMWSSYYYTEYRNENENLLDAVMNDREANHQYLRYWHGSNAIVRPLLTIFNLKQIYAVNGILFAFLVICLLFILIRHKAYLPAVGFIAGLVMTSVWFVPFSLEYTWTFLVMLLISIIGTNLAYKQKYTGMVILFLVSGMITSYLDFLTTETITLTVPLLLILWIAGRQEEQEMGKHPFVMAGKAVTAWVLGYLGMWIMKWLIASVVLSQNVMPYVSEHIDERIGGDLGFGSVQYIFSAIWNNIKCLFPFEYGVAGAFAGIALMIFVCYTGYVYHGKSYNKAYVIIYALTGLIPYVRYGVLHNHSYLHYFFTYRAQIATVFAIVLMLEQVTDRRWIPFAHGNRRKN